MDFETIKAQKEWRVEISPVTGRPRFVAENNDILYYIERMGGIGTFCKLLGVNEETANLWIDESHIPQPYADKVCAQAGANLRCIQEAWSYVCDDFEVWPPIRCAYLFKELGIPKTLEDGKTFIVPMQQRKVKKQKRGYLNISGNSSSW